MDDLRVCVAPVTLQSACAVGGGREGSAARRVGDESAPLGMGAARRRRPSQIGNQPKVHSDFRKMFDRCG
jgi:hypothetical protein